MKDGWGRHVGAEEGEMEKKGGKEGRWQGMPVILRCKLPKVAKALRTAPILSKCCAIIILPVSLSPSLSRGRAATGTDS